MSIKILTKNAVENTNIDGARINNFSAGNKNGIIKGSLNEGKFFALTSNIVTLDTCVLLISGHEIIIDESISLTVNVLPVNPVRYKVIAQVVVDDSSTPTFSINIYGIDTDLIQNNLFKTQNGSGMYQVEIGRFTATQNGIEDVVRTIDVITGGTGAVDSAITIGNVTTQDIEAGMKSEVDIDNRYDEELDKVVTDFKFAFPVDLTTIKATVEQANETANEAYEISQQKQGTVVKVDNELQTEMSFTSDPQTQIDNLIPKINEIRMYYDDTEPASIFGGTWEKIVDRFLIGAGGKYELGTMGGEENHTLTIEELPSHQHNVAQDHTTSNAPIWEQYSAIAPGVINGTKYNAWSYGTTKTGNDKPHNNMSPYLAVNIWRKIA